MEREPMNAIEVRVTTSALREQVEDDRPIATDALLRHCSLAIG